MSESANESEVMDPHPMEQAYQIYSFLGQLNIECYEILKPLLQEAINNSPAESAEQLKLILKIVNKVCGLSGDILADSGGVFDVEDSMKVSLAEGALYNVNRIIGRCVEEECTLPLSQREQAASVADSSTFGDSSDYDDAAFTSTSSSLQQEQETSFIDSPSDATESHANNDWQSDYESTDHNNTESQRGKGKKRNESETTEHNNHKSQPGKKRRKLTHHTSFVPFDTVSATAEINSAAAQFDTLNSGQSDTFTPIAIEASIVDMCKEQVVNAYLRLELGSIDRILDNVRDLMACKDMCRKEFASTEKQKVNILESVPSVSDCKTRGELLTTLSRTDKVDYNNAIQEAQRASASARAIESFQGKLTSKALRKFCLCEQDINNLLNILGNLSVGLEVLELFKVGEVISPHDNLMSLIAELHLDRYGNEIDTTEFTALQLYELAMYYLKKGEYESRRGEIRGLLLALKEQVLRSDNARAKFVAVESKGTASSSISTSPSTSTSTSTSTCSSSTHFGDKKSGKDKRRETLNLLFILSLAIEIEARAPPGLFDEYGGFMLFVLGLSWSEIKTCRNFVDADFFAPHTPKAKSSGEMFKRLVKSRKQQEKTKLVIYNKQQMNSLLALAQFD
jgi:hypothetical protein